MAHAGFARRGAVAGLIKPEAGVGRVAAGCGIAAVCTWRGKVNGALICGAATAFNADAGAPDAIALGMIGAGEGTAVGGWTEGDADGAADGAREGLTEGATLGVADGT